MLSAVMVSSRKTSHFRICEKALDAVEVVFQRLWLVFELRLDVGLEVVLRKLLQGWNPLLLTYPHFALGQRGPVRSLHRLRHALVRLLRTFPYHLAVPRKLIPPVFALRLLVNAHRFLRS